MTRFRLDLNTKIISHESRVFLARAGQKGHMFEQVSRKRAIGPDLPMLDIDLRGGFAGDQDAEAKIKRARAISEWLRTGPGKRKGRPSENLDDYRFTPKHSWHSRIIGIVRSYFHGMNAGDVVVIPNPSQFGKAIVAELLPLGMAPVKIPGEGRFHGYEFDGRSFDHFKEVRMADLPKSVVDLAKVPTGLAEIKDSAIKRRVFNLCYDDYALGCEYVSCIRTTKREFSPFDGSVLSALVTMVAENVGILARNERDANVLGLTQAVFEDIESKDFRLKIKVSSPGYIEMYDRSVVPLVVCSVLALLAATRFDAMAFADESEIEVFNSRSPELSNACNQEVKKLTEVLLFSLSRAEDDFQRTCDLLRKTHDRTGTRTNMEVEVEK